MSDYDTTESPPNKRPRLDTDSECSESSTSYSGRSGTASPTRNLAMLRTENVIDRQSFTGEKQRPKRLDNLVNLIKDDGIGMGILTQPDLDFIRAYSEEHPDERVLLSDLLNTRRLIDTTGERTNLGVMPLIADLVEILREANICEVNGHSEAAWNSEVHSPLLKAALRYYVVNQPGDTRPVKIAHTNITTAQIIERYSPYQETKPEKRAGRFNFCFYLQPKFQLTEGALLSAAQRSVHGSINHTDYIALLNRPISLSIKTDRKSGLEHMSVWLSAHCERLDELGASKERLLEAVMDDPSHVSPWIHCPGACLGTGSSNTRRSATKPWRDCHLDADPYRFNRRAATYLSDYHSAVATSSMVHGYVLAMAY